MRTLYRIIRKNLGIPYELQERRKSPLHEHPLPSSPLSNRDRAFVAEKDPQEAAIRAIRDKKEYILERKKENERKENERKEKEEEREENERKENERKEKEEEREGEESEENEEERQENERKKKEKERQENERKKEKAGSSGSAILVRTFPVRGDHNIRHTLGVTSSM